LNGEDNALSYKHVLYIRKSSGLSWLF
jgi:hypothetical protein